MFELWVHNKCRVMTSNGFMDANTLTRSYEHTFFCCHCGRFYLFRAFLVIRFLCHCKKCNDKNAYTRSFFSSLSLPNEHTLSLWLYSIACETAFLSKELHTQKIQFSLLYNSSLNVIQSSNCFRFTFFVSFQVSICSSFNYMGCNPSIAVCLCTPVTNLNSIQIKKRFVVKNKLHTRESFSFSLK